MDQAVYCVVHATLRPVVTRRLDTVSALLAKEVMTVQHVRTKVFLADVVIHFQVLFIVIITKKLQCYRKSIISTYQQYLVHNFHCNAF